MIIKISKLIIISAFIASIIYGIFNSKEPVKKGIFQAPSGWTKKKSANDTKQTIQSFTYAPPANKDGSVLYHIESYTELSPNRLFKLSDLVDVISDQYKSELSTTNLKVGKPYMSGDLKCQNISLNMEINTDGKTEIKYLRTTIIDDHKRFYILNACSYEEDKQKLLDIVSKMLNSLS